MPNLCAGAASDGTHIGILVEQIILAVSDKPVSAWSPAPARPSRDTPGPVRRSRWAGHRTATGSTGCGVLLGLIDGPQPPRPDGGSTTRHELPTRPRRPGRAAP